MITVGAADVNGTVSTDDDFNAPWSAYGYTLDGFLKPELGAPGRYMSGAVPTDATMYAEHPERVVEPGYMWMSGTSFAAPVVAGAAADLLALNPSWTPDDVKGALMLTAGPTGAGTGAYALGVGEVQAAAAAAVVDPPNPNAALEQYVVSDSNGSPTFDAASWSSERSDGRNSAPGAAPRGAALRGAALHGAAPPGAARPGAAPRGHPARHPAAPCRPPRGRA